MKKLTAILSILFVAGFAYQTMVFADTTTEKKHVVKKTNFTSKHKKVGTPAPTPSVSPSPVA